jgi:hypothetical protein
LDGGCLFAPLSYKQPKTKKKNMTTLSFSFDTNDKTGRGSVFVYKNGKKTEVYLRARVANLSHLHAGAARVFLTRLEKVDNKGEKTVITSDTLPLNWALMSGADVVFYPDYEHYVDLLTFTLGGKTFEPMTVGKKPIYWKKELSSSGIYRLHLLLTGPAIKPVAAIFELKWPAKKTDASSFSFTTHA